MSTELIDRIRKSNEMQNFKRIPASCKLENVNLFKLSTLNKVDFLSH